MEPTLGELRARAAEAPTDGENHRALVDALVREGERRELAELHERWAELVGEGEAAARSLVAAAEVREAIGDVDRALRHCLRALDLDPRQHAAATHVARMSMELREPHRHLDALTRWASRLGEVGASDLERAQAELTLARAYGTLPGKLERSFQHHREAVRLDPSLEPTLDESIDRAEKARRTKDVRGLLALGAESAASPERRFARLRALANAMRTLPVDLDGAIDTLADASTLVADDPTLLQERIALHLQRARKHKGTDQGGADQRTAAALELTLASLLPEVEARDAARRALVLDDRSDDAIRMLDALSNGVLDDADRQAVLAGLHRRVERAEDATAELAARLALSSRLAAEERFEDAFSAIEPVLASTDRAEVLARALTLARQAGRSSDAGSLAERVHSNSPETVRVVLEDLLRSSLDAGDFRAVEDLAERLLARIENHAGALAALCTAYQRTGRPTELRRVLERRYAVGPKDERKAVLEELVATLDGPLADREAALDAFEKLAALDPRDRTTREALKVRLGELHRARSLADVLRWEIGHLEAVSERKQALDALLELAEREPFDATLLVSALRTHRAADPADPAARAALARILRSAGEAKEAASLEAEAVRAAHTDAERLVSLAALADLLEHALRDDEGAWRATQHTLEIAPADEAAITRLERLAERHGHRDRLVLALGHRAGISVGEARLGVLLRMASLHEVTPADPAAAVRAYEQVRQLSPEEPTSAAALLRLYEEDGRHGERARLLADLAERATDPEAKIGYLREQARVLRDHLDDAEGAAACLRQLRAVREDEDALAALIVHARSRDHEEELAELLATRIAAADDPEELVELRMERATLLLDRLGDPREAERELKAVRVLDPSFAPALGRLASLYSEEGDDIQLAEVTEAHLELTSAPQHRAMLAKRLVGLYTGTVPDPPRALEAARRWCAAAPFDVDAWRASSGQLDPELHPAEHRAALDSLADELTKRRSGSEGDARALRDEAFRALEDSVRTSVQRLDDGNHAEARLVKALELGHDDPSDVERFIRLAVALDPLLEPPRLRLAAATFLARKATTVARPLKEKLFLRAADLFGGPLADARRAFQVMRRAIDECIDDADVLQSLVEYGSAGGFEDELLTVLEERFEKCLDARAARAMQRERANLLYTLGRYGEAADAYQRITVMEPDDERARARHRECLMHSGRHEDLVITLGQALRKLGHGDREARLALLRDIARAWDSGLDDRTEAEDSWKRVLALDPADEEASAALERLVALRAGGRHSQPPRGSIPPPLPTHVAAMPRMPSLRPVRGSIPPPAPDDTEE